MKAVFQNPAVSDKHVSLKVGSNPEKQLSNYKTRGS
jgi:hypothetical protein